MVLLTFARGLFGLGNPLHRHKEHCVDGGQGHKRYGKFNVGCDQDKHQVVLELRVTCVRFINRTAFDHVPKEDRRGVQKRAEDPGGSQFDVGPSFRLHPLVANRNEEGCLIGEDDVGAIVTANRQTLL